jgi:hypothetical protein
MAALGVGVLAQTAEADASPVRARRVRTTTAAAVPEIPASGSTAALTLILGGTAIALDRRRRRQAK